MAVKTIKDLDLKLARELAETKDLVSKLEERIIFLGSEISNKQALETRIENLESLETRIENLESLETRIENLEAKTQIKNLESLESRIENLEADNKYAGIRHDLLARLVDDQGQYSRKINLIVDGLRINQGDNDNHIRKVLMKHIENLDLDIDQYDIDRAHRTGRTYQDKNGNQHTPVIVRFTSWRARNCLYEARKKSSLFIKADLTTRRQNLFETALQIFEEDSSLARLIAYVFVDRNCQLSVKTTDGRFLRFNSIEEYKRLPDFIEKTLPPYAAIEKVIANEKKRSGEKFCLTNLSGLANDKIKEWMDDESHAYIGRDHGTIEGSIFQNPYSLADYDRTTAIKKYRQHISSNPTLEREVESLRGKVLGCFCWPEDCHGQVLLEILNDV